MAYSLASARKLCNTSEFDLVALSFSGAEVRWAPARLKLKIERTRRLRDKFRDRKREIRRTNQATVGSKTGPRVSAMAVAEQKAQLFDEALARFVAKLDQLNAARKLGALKAAVAKAAAAKRAARKAPAPSQVGPRAKAAVSGGRRTAASAAGTPSPVLLKRKIANARVRARNSRTQAKRDGRR